MSPVKFIPSHEKTLRSFAITNEAPGTILHDFQVMLDFVAEASPQLTDGLVLQMKVLKPLDEQLNRRFEHDLSRAQQKSYPHINGLFLLLRATGLTLVDTSGRKPMLVVDPSVIESWDKLNPEERYFALLESWLVRGDEEIIGEQSGRFEYHHPLILWDNFFERLEQKIEKDEWIERVRYFPGIHNLALMELFGLVTVEDAPIQPKKGWQIANVQVTEWGKALLALLSSKLFGNDEFWAKLTYPQEIPPGELQPVIQPYRPGWQHTLQLPDMGFQEGLFVFKVSLDENVWRMITIPATHTLEDLSHAIRTAYKFDDDHLYRFLYATRFGLTTEVTHPYMAQEPATDEVRIGDLPAQPGFQMVFNFDFGDNWNFDVVLERIDPPNPKVTQYRIGKRQGRSPEQYPEWE